MKRKNIPFEFVLDYLTPLDFTVKQMFGMWAIYVNDKIMLILRDRKDFENTNGVWVATSQEYHNSIKTDLPSLTSISNYSGGLKETEWQLLPVEANDFEESVRKVCDMIKRNDRRIGRIPGIGKSKGKNE